MFYIYIHGFNSGRASRSGAALEALLQKPVLRVENDYSQPFETVLAGLEAQIAAQARPDSALCLMGTSLGGFYALQLRLPNIAKVAAWNPVIFPALQLERFLGENVRFTDGSKWNFSRQAQLSYAAAPDPRPWRNAEFLWRHSADPCPARQIYLGDHDELLDHELSRVFWTGHAPVAIISSGHSVEDFSGAASFLA